MNIKSIAKCKNLKGKTVLIRIDVNVPIKNGKILDDTRIKAHVPTIFHCISHGAKVLLIAHLGRPKGKKKASLSLKPVANKLSRLLKKRVRLLPDFSEETIKTAGRMKFGSVALMENIRFFSGEKENDPKFAKQISSFGDIFVQDGFAVSHRSTTSTVGLPKLLPTYYGLLLEKELFGLNKLLKKTRHPFVFVLGGAKVSTKMPVLKKLTPISDKVLIGGGLITTYLFAKGYSVGKSIVEKELTEEILKLAKKKKIVLPVDVMVGTLDGKEHHIVDIGKNKKICKQNQAVLDIGPKTIAMYINYIKKAKMIVWNGALGYFEQPPFHLGTMSIAAAIAKRSNRGAYTVIGGGETVQSMEMVGHTKDISLVSTGGGAMLSYLSGENLPAIKAIENSV